MKKQLITILISVVLLGGLLGVYFYTQNKQNQTAEEPEPTPAASESIKLIDKDKEDITSVTIKNESGTLTFVPHEKKDDDDKQNWELSQYPELALNNSNVDSMLTPLYYLSPSEMLEGSTEPSEYGMDNPLATATASYADGGSVTILIGQSTPGGDYYYIMKAGDSDIYMLNPTTSKRFFNSLSSLVDKTLPTIDTENLTYVYINETGKQEVEFAYDGTDTEMQETLETYGMVSLSMTKPYPGRDLYLSNFQANVTENFTNYSLGDLVEPYAADLASYGLETPRLHIIMDDAENRLELLVGNEDGEGNVYVKPGNHEHVFKMSANLFTTFFDINVFKFIDRFVALTFIDTVDSITIDAPAYDRHYEIALNHEIIKATEEGKSDEDIIHPEINGAKQEESPFRKLYSAIIGLAYDTEVKDYSESGDPAMTIVYKLNNGKDDIIISFYEYNDNFYAVKKDDFPIQFVTNIKSVRDMFATMDSLLAGDLK